MQATLIYFQDQVSHDYTVHEISEPLTAIDAMKRHGYWDLMHQRPIVTMLNDRELLEKDYGTVLKDGDILSLICIAQEGVTLATWIYYILIAAVAIYTYNNIPKLPEGTEVNQGSSTYSLRQNRARLGQPKPVLYGTLRIYPDLSAKPFSEFSEDGSNEQEVHMLFELTEGECEIDINTARFEDTDLSTFVGATSSNYYKLYLPGQVAAKFPANIDTSAAVTNLDIADGDFSLTANPDEFNYNWDYFTYGSFVGGGSYVFSGGGTGPFAVCQPGDTVSKIAIDVTAPEGIWKTRSSGKPRDYKVTIDVYARKIDDDGNFTGSGEYTRLGRHVVSSDKNEVLRRTLKYDVDDARYEVIVARVTGESDATNIHDTLQWTALKGYVVPKKTAAEIAREATGTRLYLKVRSKDTLTQNVLQQFSIVAKRKLKTWNSTTGWSASSVQTNNPMWAFADAVTNTTYGGKRADQWIDLPTVEALANQFDSEGIECNGMFDTRGDLWDKLKIICTTCFSSPIDNFGVYTPVRDISQNPIQLFTHRNIVRGTFNISYIGVTEETADALDIEFLNEDDNYRPNIKRIYLSGSPQNKPMKMKLWGVTSEAQVKKIGQKLAAENFFRRTLVSWETGLEGRIPFFGDTVYVSHIVIGDEKGSQQISGEVVAWDGGTQLTLSESTAGFATPYIILRKKDGSPLGPLTMTITDDRTINVTDGAFDSGELSFDAGYERTHYAMGNGTLFQAKVKINAREKATRHTIRLSGFVDRSEVYSAIDAAPAIPTLPTLPSRTPVIERFTATVRGDIEEPIVFLNWIARNSEKFTLEHSTDGGTTWIETNRGFLTGNSFEHSPDPGTVFYRIAGWNALKGQYAQITVDATQVQVKLPDPVTVLQLRETFTGPTLKVQWTTTTLEHKVQIVKNPGVGETIVYTENVTVNQDLPGTVNWDFTAEQGRAVNSGRSFQVRVTALNGGLESAPVGLSVSNPEPGVLNNLSINSINELIIISFDPVTDTDFAGVNIWVDSTSGFTENDGNKIYDKTFSTVIKGAIAIGQTLYVRTAALDAWDHNDYTLSGEVEVTGNTITETQITDDAVTSPKIRANNVLASHISVANLAAIKTQTGELITDLVKTTSNATGVRGELSNQGDWPIWFGAGTKDESGDPGNYILKLVASEGRLYLKALTIEDASGETILSTSGVEWSKITGSGKPQDNADVTANNTAAAIAGQGALATASSADWATQLSNKPDDYTILNNYKEDSVFSETFETTESINSWELVSGLGERTVITSTDTQATGGKILQMGNNSGNDQVWILHKQLIPFEENTLYEYRARLKRLSGAGTSYLGFAGVAGDGVTYVNSAGNNSIGSQHYIATSGANPGTGFKEYVGYVKGRSSTGSTSTSSDPLNPGKAHDDVRYMRPLILTNYNNVAGQTYCDSFYVKKIPLDSNGVPILSGDKTQIPNWNFEQGDVVWGKTDSTCTIEKDVVNAFSGSWVAKASYTGGASNKIFRNVLDGVKGGLPTKQGDKFLIEGMIKTSSNAAFSFSAWRASWRDSTGSQIAVSYSSQITSANTNWQKLRGVVVAPANTAYAVLEFVAGGQTDGIVYFDNGMLTPALQDSDVDALQTTNGPAQAGADVTSANNQSPSWLTSPVVWSGNQITSANVATYVATSAFGSTQLADSAVTTAKLASLAVDATKLANSAVTSTKIANAAVGSAAIANLAVGNAHIANSSVTNAKIGNAEISTAKIQNSAITNALIANAAITNAKIENAAISTAKIGDLQVSTIKVEDNAITIPSGVYTSGNVAIAVGSATDVQSLIHASSGAKVFVKFSCQYSLSSNGNMTVRLLEDGNVLEAYTVFGTNSNNNFFSFVYSKTPTVASHTYKVSFDHSGATGCVVFRRALEVTEYKK